MNAELVKIFQEDSVSVSEANPENLIRLSGNAPLEVFPFVTELHREVILRHHDGTSEDIELTPDEADALADRLKIAAAAARLLEP